MVSSVLGCWLLGFLVAWFLGFLVSWCLVSWFLGLVMSWFQSFKDSEVPLMFLIDIDFISKVFEIDLDGSPSFSAPAFSKVVKQKEFQHFEIYNNNMF